MPLHKGMNELAALRLRREREVRLALSRDEFVPLFQPIVDAARGELRGFEAMLHWRNREEGMLPSPTFLDVLEETGLVEAIGRRVIRESCGQAIRWHGLTGSLVPVSMSVVPMQLAVPDFCDHVARCLTECGLPARALILELAASALVSRGAKTHAALNRLRDLGVGVRIVGFAAGHPALAYLHELPVTGIKLDRGWLERPDDTAERREIARAVVALAHRLEMDVVAEDIETMSQFQSARELGCDFAQGCGLSRPLDAEQAMRYARRHTACLTQITIPDGRRVRAAMP